uniref:6-phosphogluconate dehydrogenase, NAD-binding protein n=1 Tax=Sphingomonas sp. JE1 TaxID=1628059 RepID=A0A0D5A012_9SPHN|nr:MULTISPECIES: NAD(P)-dependent oxidoreductase [unclassified Sphingomonas]AJW29595.1 6-phosphogluconate dehydrogenase, NAD-binding protein [Sphingomonas sp. JE1]
MTGTSTARVPVIGMVGVGRLGRSIAERLINTCPLVLHDISDEAVAPFRGRAQIAGNLGSLAAQVDIIIACLPSARACHGAVSSAVWPVGARARIFVNLGSAEAALADEMAAILGRHDIAMFAAPVSGNAVQAASGELTILASGPGTVFDEVKPVLCRFAREIFYLGESVALAQAAKLINNFLSLSNLAFASEAAVLGAKAGIDPQLMLDVFNAGLGQSSATKTRLAEYILPGRFQYGRSLDLVLADLRAFQEQSSRAGIVASPLGDAVAGVYRRAAEALSPKADVSEVIRPMEQDAGTLVRWRSVAS